MSPCKFVMSRGGERVQEDDAPSCLNTTKRYGSNIQVNFDAEASTLGLSAQEG